MLQPLKHKGVKVTEMVNMFVSITVCMYVAKFEYRIIVYSVSAQTQPQGGNGIHFLMTLEGKGKGW